MDTYDFGDFGDFEDPCDPFEEIEQDEPDREDAFVSSDGWRFTVSFAGRHLGTTPDEDVAWKWIREAAARGNFYPNAWFVSDHGNIDARDYHGRAI